ncbi:formyltransferase family protein [Sulfurimonas sp.]
MNLAVLASHNGSAVDAIFSAIESQKLALNLVLIVSNNSNANVLQKASNYGIKHLVINKKNTQNPDEELYNALKEHNCELVFLAGYMKKIPAKITKNFAVLNSHPALLPKFGGSGMYGEFVHQAVIESQEIESGVSIHEVNEEYDDGKIILQKKLILSSNETVETLQKRVKQLEKSAIIEALKLCLK